MIVGYVTGKFMPLHKGHELLLNMAATNCDLLFVHICSDEGPFSVDLREKWVRQALVKFGHTGFVVAITKPIEGNWNTDEHGTITDDEFWHLYVQQVKQEVTGQIPVDYVFSSDRYGLRIAEELGNTYNETFTKWVPIDPNREVIPISASKIRSQPFAYGSMLPDYVLKDVSKTVAVVGPESVGKSTLVKNLGRVLNVMIANEWGRTLFEATRDQFDLTGSMEFGQLTESDFVLIYNSQLTMIEQLRSQQYLTIADTEAITTTLFQEQLCPNEVIVETIRNWWKQQMGRFDMYIVLAPTVPFVQDGTRLEDMEHRQQVYEQLLEQLKPHPNVVVITSSDYTERFNQALNAIADLTQQM